MKKGWNYIYIKIIKNNDKYNIINNKHNRYNS